MTDDELDDLLGGAPTEPPAPKLTVAGKKRGRPTKEEVASRKASAEAIHNASIGRTSLDVREFVTPVSQNFLATVLRMDPATVKKRLLKCPIAGYGAGNRPVYDFKTAIEYLIKPRMTVKDWLQTLNHADMPNEVNKVFWEARRTRLKYELEAGEAWATQDVLAVFGETFMTIKDRTQLWVETLRDAGLTDEQSSKLEQMVDSYLNDLHEKLVDIPKQRQTRSKLAEIEEVLSRTPYSEAVESEDDE